MIASVNIQTNLRNGITTLGSTYFTTPFKVANITEDKKSATLHLMLMSASPGILDEDVYDIKVDLCEGASLQLHTQSYQRLFNMKSGASQHFEVKMGTGSSFCYLPHPAVPHELSDFTAINNIYLEKNCRLVFGEILTCGRKQNGEVFSLTRYHNQTNIFLNQQLVIKENLLIQPSLLHPTAIGQLEGFSHQVSLIFLQEVTDIKEVKNEINALLSHQKEIVFGISAAPVSGLVVRILGQHGEQLHQCLQAIADILPQPVQPLINSSYAD